MTGRPAKPPAFGPRCMWRSLAPHVPVAVTVFLFCLIALPSVGEASDSEPGNVETAVEIRIPLYEGTHHRPRDLARQYRARFDAPLQVEDVSDAVRRLTPGEWAALQAAHLLGVINVERRTEELLLRFMRKPEEGDRRAASWLEALGVPARGGRLFRALHAEHLPRSVLIADASASIDVDSFTSMPVVSAPATYLLSKDLARAVFGCRNRQGPCNGNVRNFNTVRITNPAWLSGIGPCRGLTSEIPTCYFRPVVVG